MQSALKVKDDDDNDDDNNKNNNNEAVVVIAHYVPRSGTTQIYQGKFSVCNFCYEMGGPKKVSSLFQAARDLQIFA